MDGWIDWRKMLLLIAVGSTSILTALTPILTMIGDYVAMITVRVAEGVGQVCDSPVSCQIRPSAK